MIEWSDEAFLLSQRPQGETAAIVQLLTRQRGRHAGLVQGGQGSRMAPLLQPGNLLRATWRARLSEHLGSFRLEPVTAYAARFLDTPDRLMALSSATALLESGLAEREAHPACFLAFAALLEALEGPHWAESYVAWELGLLGELGFGLDLETCAAGGDPESLAFVSPRSGRAVSRAAGTAYADRLLPLPDFLAGRGGGGAAEVALGLRLTGYFLEKHLFRPRDRSLPPARHRLEERFASA